MAQAQSSNSLPDYVIEQFGEAPVVPLGPLSPALEFAARVAFIDSTKLSIWDKNQKQALTAIGESGDPRFAWIISDMLRFASRRTHKPLTPPVKVLTDPATVSYTHLTLPTNREV